MASFEALHTGRSPPGIPKVNEVGFPDLAVRTGHGQYPPGNPPLLAVCLGCGRAAQAVRAAACHAVDDPLIPSFRGAENGREAGGEVSRHPSAVEARVFAPGCRRRFAALRPLETLGPQPATIRTLPEPASWEVRLRPSSENSRLAPRVDCAIERDSDGRQRSRLDQTLAVDIAKRTQTHRSPSGSPETSTSTTWGAGTAPP
jgi:hypothetical protein